MNPKIVDKIKEQTEPMIVDLGYELVELKYETGRNLVFYIYKKGGLDLDSCEFLSRKIGYFLDNEMEIKDSYNLVVSSPELTRNLVSDDDFRRNFGEVLKVKVRNPIEKEYNLVGKLIKYSDDFIEIQDKKENVVQIERNNIKKASIFIDI